MKNKYDWTEKFKAELDKLDEHQIDYDQVQQLKRIKKLWDKKYKSLMDEMTMMDGEPILIKLHNEISLELLHYIRDYISRNEIPMDGITISRDYVHSGRKRVHVHLNRSEMKIPHSYRFNQSVHDFGSVAVIRDMTGVDIGNNTWTTVSVYEAFQEAKQKNPNWIQKYCADITHALDLIKENSKKVVDIAEEEW